ncbi:acyl carrier protein [Streptomyces syringium]|uniref:acyl carrier protein n=1 Tax=Streptomyces syringium TaxID=76729 RepID=UPI003D915997
MTTAPALTKELLVEILAEYGEREADDIAERVDSLELAWLVHSLEERYGLELDLDDVQLARMTTLDAALAVLGEVLPSPEFPSPESGSADGAETGGEGSDRKAAQAA